MTGSPNLVAVAASETLKKAAGGRVGIVSKPGSSSPMDVLTKVAVAARDTLFDTFGPTDFNVPGTAPIARAMGVGISKAADATATGIKNVSTGAAEGVKSGFKWATFALVAVVGLYVWSVIRPRG